MRVAIVCFGAMRAFLPPGTVSNRAELEVAPGSRVADLVDHMGAPRRLVFAVLVDGGRADLEDPLHDGAEVTLMPPFAGGSYGAGSSNTRVSMPARALPTSAFTSRFDSAARP
jgi:molybdopterin converting factor small subunit